MLITCDTANLASARVIEKNGGRLVFQGMVEQQAEPISHYWIDLPAQFTPSAERTVSAGAPCARS